MWTMNPSLLRQSISAAFGGWSRGRLGHLYTSMEGKDNGPELCSP